MIPVQTGFLARIVLLLCVVIPGEAGVVVAQQFEIIDLRTLGGTRSWARAITEGGNVARWATNASSVKHAVLWEPSIVDLGAPDGFIVSEAVGVNESRQVAGNGEGNPQAYQAYLWENDAWTPLGVLPGRTESIAEDIDSSGRIVGWSFSFGAGNDGGFIWQAGEMTDLGNPEIPRDPEAVVSDHVEGMTEHLGLTSEQQDAIREVLRRRMPELLALQHRAREANRLLAESFAAPDFDPARFDELARRATVARTQVDSVSATLLMAEAELLTAEQREKYATVVPAVHTDPRRVAPPPRPGRRSGDERAPR